MSITLKELDEMWQGSNLDKSQLKYLCRKYGPLVIIEWINRGITIHDKEKVINWYKQKLLELGYEFLEKPKEVPDERLFKDDFGDYFSE
jgi:hypothetical protein